MIPNDRATFSESYTEIQVTKMFGQKNTKGDIAFGVFFAKHFCHLDFALTFGECYPINRDHFTT